MTTITISRAVAQQALEALEYENSWHKPRNEKPYVSTLDAITALRAALAQPAPEPVECSNTFACRCHKHYTAPPQRKPLTDEEIDRITDAQWASNNHKPIYAAHRAYARAVEAAHGIIDSGIQGDKA